MVHGCCLLRFESAEGKGEEEESAQQIGCCRQAQLDPHVNYRDGSPRLEGEGGDAWSRQVTLLGLLYCTHCLIREVDPTGGATGRPAAHGCSLHFLGRGKP